MIFSEHPSHILDAWFLFEAFRRLGFASRDIYALVMKAEDHGNLWFAMLLKTQKKEFTALIQPVNDDDEDTLQMWATFASRIADGQFDEQDMQRVWTERLGRLGAETLIARLLTNGFYLPLSKH